MPNEKNKHKQFWTATQSFNRTRISARHAPRMRYAASVLMRGGLVAYPTEAVWGLGVDPYHWPAVKRLLRLKCRNISMGMILIADRIQRFRHLLKNISASAHQRLEDSWPGPVTWLVQANEYVPPWISGNSDCVALRVTAHPQAAMLCNAFGGIVVSTSANPHKAQPAKYLFQVRHYFGGQIDAVVPGNVGGLQRPTEIRRLSDMSVVRAG